MFRPKLFDLLPKLSRRQIVNDIIAGVIVGIVALPLAIAFGIASGVSPEKGLITAVIGGFIVSFLGGSRVQIGGPTGAFIVIVFGIIQQHGIDGLLLATFMAGIILIIMGFARFGSLIKFIPYPVVVGFTSGIAVVIFSTQINDFFGMGITGLPADVTGKWAAYFSNIKNISYPSLFTGAFSLLIMIFWPKITAKIPGSIIAILAATALVQFFNLEVQTIESRFGEIPSSIPLPSIPFLDFSKVRDLIIPATTIAILAAIEALLSAVVADGMTGGRHRSNTELIAQGAANIFSPLFGGIPVTGAIARTATNIKNGGRTPVAGLVHAVTLFLIMLLFGKWAKLIPMPALAAILIMVAYNMSEYRVFRQLLKSPRSDVAVLLTTFALTVIFDLTVAIEIGMALAAILFMKRMAAVSGVNVATRELKDSEAEEADPFNINIRQVPEDVEVYEINGPFFFGAAAKFKEASRITGKPPKVRIIRMRNVPAIDATGLNLLKEVLFESRKEGSRVIFSGVHAQPLFAFTQYGLLDEIGEDNITGNIDEAIALSKSYLEKMEAAA